MLLDARCAAARRTEFGRPERQAKVLLMTSASQKSSDAVEWPPWARVTVSLLLFAHLFFVFVALAANVAPSRLQQRLLARFSFYTQLLNLDLNFAPLYLTHASIDDVDHRLELLPEGRNADVEGDWVVLPDVGVRGSDRYERYQRLARGVVFFAARRSDRGSGAGGRVELPQPARHSAAASPLSPTSASGLEHDRAGTSAQRDPNDPSYFRVAYDASFVVSRDGAVSVVKLAEADELASPIAKDGARDASNP